MSTAAPLRPRFHGRVPHADKRLCAAPGCAELGEFKAPLDFNPHTGDTPPPYQWLCLEHVRAFNTAYDAFKAMSPEEIAANHGHPGAPRPSWPFASNGGGFGRAADLHLHDPLDMFAGQPGFGYFTARPVTRNGVPLGPADSTALKVLGLAADVTPRALKSRYKALVRQFHPDSNGGDRSQEVQLRKVIDAYTRLSKSPAFAAGPKA